MELRPIGYVRDITKTRFKSEYLDTRKPVIIENFVKDTPGLARWDYSYFIQQAGEKIVDVHGKEDDHPDRVTSPPRMKMKFSDYLELIEREPSDLRLFLFNLLVEKPELRKDIQVDKLADHQLSWLPFLFFGGKGSSVRYHYDIDMSHVFLSQLKGEKKIYLFANDQSPFLYQLPFNFHGLADLKAPDYAQFPALKYLRGWECTLRPGETLFIPSGYWHYIQYLADGYSVSHRALSSSLLDRAKGFQNILITRKIDNTMRKILGRWWFNYKVNKAHERASTAIWQILEARSAIPKLPAGNSLWDIADLGRRSSYSSIDSEKNILQ
jgi:hypothetical protein